MPTDFLSPCLSVAAFLRIGGQLNAASKEILAYQGVVSLGVAQFESVESARMLLSRPRLVYIDLQRLDQLNRQLQIIDMKLRGATSAFSWIPRDARRNLKIGLKERVTWVVTHKDTARANTDLVKSCTDMLVNIKAEINDLIQASNRPTPHERFFDEIQRQTMLVLSERGRKNAQLYSGPGEQLSRSVAVALLTIQ